MEHADTCQQGSVQTTQKLSEISSENHKSLLLFDKKMQFGYKRCKTYLKYYLKQTEKRNEKRGSISYASPTAIYSPIQQPSVPGVSLCSSWPCYPIIRSFSDIFFVKLSINNHVVGLAHKNHITNEILRTIE